jgi:hypothetical protein
MMCMGGLGLCLCCKQDKLLTEHHDKEIKEKIMICRDCHDVIEDYLKLIEKYSQLVLKDNQSSIDKESAPGFKNEDSALSSEKQLAPLERTDNNSSYDTAAQPSITLPNEQVQSLRDLLGEYKKKKH